MVEAKDVIRSIDKAGEGALRTAGRWAGKAIGNLIAPVVGGQVAGAIGDALGRLIYRIGQFWLASLAASFILTVVGIVILLVFTASALFVINSGAYIVPPAGPIAGANITLSEGCPQGWPFAMPSYTVYISQGADGVYTHNGFEALDITVQTGTPILATHPGIATVINNYLGNTYGNNVRIQSLCNGVPFVSIYAHLTTIDPAVSTGTLVQRGQAIGYSGNTGTNNDGRPSSTGPHLHYEFRLGQPTSYTRAGPPPANPPFMLQPFIPVSDIPRGCGDVNSCNYALN